MCVVSRCSSKYGATYTFKSAPLLFWRCAPRILHWFLEMRPRESHHGHSPNFFNSMEIANRTKLRSKGKIFPIFFERPTMHRSQRGVAVARRIIVSKPCFLQTARFLPISVRLAHTLPTKVIAPRQCTSIRCSSTINSAKVNSEDVPEFLWPGDWICGNCQAHNYRNRTACFECQTSNDSGRVFYTPGMWHCPKCNQGVKISGSLSPPPPQFLSSLTWGGSRCRLLLAMSD